MPERACTHRHMWTSGFCEDCVETAYSAWCVQVGCVLVGEWPAVSML